MSNKEKKASSYKVLEEILNQKKVTPYRLSKDIGFSQATLTDWKRGNSIPNAFKLVKIADYLDVDAKEFIEKIGGACL